jgi:GT2 family glycosyltransferase
VRELLNKCLHSIEKFIQLPTLEIVVVDNNSKDGTEEIIRNNFPHVKLIVNNQNLGFAKACNIAVDNCKGDYILLLNPDTQFIDNSLMNMINYMKVNPTVGIIGGKILNPDGTFMHSCSSFPNLWNYFCEATFLYKIFSNSRIFGKPYLSYLNYDEVQKVDAILGAFFLIRRKVISSIGVFDEKFFMYAEEIDYCYRAKKSGWQIFYFPHSKIMHLGGESTKQNKFKMRVELMKSKNYYLTKHHGKSFASLASVFQISGAFIRLSIWILPVLFFLIFSQKLRKACFEKILFSCAPLIWLIDV